MECGGDEVPNQKGGCEILWMGKDKCECCSGVRDFDVGESPEIQEQYASKVEFFVECFEEENDGCEKWGRRCC